MENEKPILRGELALIAAIVINSFSVVLMLYSGSGISAISSVPYAFSEVFTKLSLGTWTYLFQGALVLSLMILRKKFVPSYLFSFVAGFAFSELLDVNELWIGILPQTIPCRIAYFLISYFLLSIGIGLENRCQLPKLVIGLRPEKLPLALHHPPGQPQVLQRVPPKGHLLHRHLPLIRDAIRPGIVGPHIALILHRRQRHALPSFQKSKALAFRRSS